MPYSIAGADFQQLVTLVGIFVLLIEKRDMGLGLPAKRKTLSNLDLLRVDKQQKFVSGLRPETRLNRKTKKRGGLNLFGGTQITDGHGPAISL